jgi:hypothetical protein
MKISGPSSLAKDANFPRDNSQNRRRLVCVSSESVPQEIVMLSVAANPRIVGAAFGIVALSWANVALASQGPGTSVGTASPFTQLAMAVLVYGMSALVVGAGLIGALRRH